MDPAEALAAAELDIKAAAELLAPAVAEHDRLTTAVYDAALSTTGMLSASMTLMAIRPHKLTAGACQLLRERAGWMRLGVGIAAAMDDHAAAVREVDAAAADAAAAVDALANAKTASAVDFLQGGGLGMAAGISTNYHVKQAGVAAADVCRKAAAARALTGGRMPRVRPWTVASSPLLDVLNIAFDNLTADLLVRKGIVAAAADAEAAVAEVGRAAAWAHARADVMAADAAGVAGRLAAVEEELRVELKRHVTTLVSRPRESPLVAAAAAAASAVAAAPAGGPAATTPLTPQTSLRAAAAEAQATLDAAVAVVLLTPSVGQQLLPKRSPTAAVAGAGASAGGWEPLLTTPPAPPRPPPPPPPAQPPGGGGLTATAAATASPTAAATAAAAGR
ncbi:hypothetical protein I4F81_007708 [Pyropia yezoensis]|uniref:Uncharacterized protein n=1 Tax=Pyropia yezoensis TaxID=2788 RepID=A0ACC3C5W9_PYRYE|nr:hypothetical protein I4F81_007708 [Neopyropia yezoensis]